MQNQRPSLILLAGLLSLLPVVAASAQSSASTEGERLYNGIVLPPVWPPRPPGSPEPTTRAQPAPIPYLQAPPAVIPIDVGRQLLVDDFLIAKTTLRRVFHQPEKYSGNPVLKPETELENNKGFCPSAAPFSDGCFYDPKDGLFKLWYMAGWYGGQALATSRDGIHWERPAFDVVPGTNAITDREEPLRRDGVSLWLDHDAKNPKERFKMLQFVRTGAIGFPGLGKGAGYLLTSPDGIHWTRRGTVGPSGDNTTMFYNPFRQVWVFSHRDRRPGFERMREYWENKDFFAALHDWDGYDPVFWVAADALDHPHPAVGDPPQIYKVDAVAYESLMLGMIQVHYGPSNDQAAEKGIPKLTQLQVAFSRDGFHWDRPSRDIFIGATLKKESWERAYVTSTGGVCLVVGDKLYFYYAAFQGDESKPKSERLPHNQWTGMYANASTGLAVLRRDGFASMETDSEGVLTTRPLSFQGRHLFVNADCAAGELRAEVLDEQGRPVAPFTLDNSVAFSGDSTLQALSWKNGEDLAALAGRPVRLRFHLKKGQLYSFWVSSDRSGASHGYVAAGGPGFTGPVDTVGVQSYPKTAR